MMPTRVLIIEDDPNIAELISLYLEKDGFDVTLASDGKAGVDTFFSIHPDIVLLDIMLPEMDGWEVCREIRKSDKTPIIMLTAKDETADKVTGLELGADDYISKPFDMKEVIARIHAVLRRYTPGNEAAENADIKSFDNLSINMSAYEVLIKGKKVDMPPKELELLNYLASHPNRVFTRNQLLDDVWGFEYFGDSRTVDVHVKRLREKIDGASEKWSLKTVWGVGYKFELNPDK
ncbi:MAG: response regulator transcription factor [Oscillospiraceae bacterium]|nr:response regulator transcription factor [Oscillospiraceae bacterium]